VKLKRLPEDFVVEELSSFPISGGPFAVYRLEKRSLGTPEAINAIVERWNVPRKRISYGGLKDKHAVTSQFVTIHNGPRKHFEQRSFSLTYLGQAERHFDATDIDGNRFSLVMRDMTKTEAEATITAANDIAGRGVPNYFDDQRFGSLGYSREWIGKFWCQGNYERALWLALADAHPDDRSDEKREKQILRDHWGRWTECKEALSRSHRRSVITYLADKEATGKTPDFRGAFSCLSIDLRGLYLSAFQSALWNRMLTQQLAASFAKERLIPIELESGLCWFVRGLSIDEFNSLRDLEFPLPSARQKLEPGPVLDLVNQAVATEGLELRELRVKYPRDSFFSKGSRAAFMSLSDLTTTVTDDDLYPRCQKVNLSFSLPRGSYATIVVKRVTSAE
jgi:tRNA pseudouridine13 synthase